MDSFGNNGFESSNKRKCEELRQIRVKMADTLGVPDVVRREPCNYKGECKGTCPACYMEERALLDRMYELSKNGMMDMLFGEDIKILKDNAYDDILMGEDELGDVEEYSFDEDVTDIFEKPSGSEQGLFDNIELNPFGQPPIDTAGPIDRPPFVTSLPGQIIPQPWTTVEDMPKPVDNKQTNKKKGIKIPGFLKGNK